MGDNRLCATRFAPLYTDTATALGVWRALREDNVRLCAAVSPDDLERVGLEERRAHHVPQPRGADLAIPVGLS